MAKPLPIRIPSDDFTMTVRGKTYHPHEAEWVEMIPVQTVADARAWHLISQLQSDVEAAAGDTDALMEVNRIGTEQMYVLASSLANRIIAWSWTDMRGRELPQPDGDPESFVGLTTEELFYLISLNEESALGKLNGSPASASTSSGTKSSRSTTPASRNGTAPSRSRSSTARSRTKVS